MDERENSTTPAPAAPTTALPTVENPHPKLVKNRGPAIAFLVVAIVLVIGLVATVAALVYSAQKPSAGFVGRWAAGIQSLEISPSGEARGTDGCNGQSSRWHAEGNRIVFEGFMGTMMACMGPGDRMLNGWLGQAASAELQPGNPNQLVFFDQTGGQLGYMVRNGAVEPLPQQPVMPTGEPFLPGPTDPQVPGPADDWDSLVDPSAPMPGAPDPRPMQPKIPGDRSTDDGSGIPSP